MQNTKNNTNNEWATACLALSDGSILWGHRLFPAQDIVGEVCFNTGMSGYQEIMTDPSYAGHIVCFTYPHIGNVGINIEDMEAFKPHAAGFIMRNTPTSPSNYRANKDLKDWLKENNLPVITHIDTRKLTRKIRDQGALNGVIFTGDMKKVDTEFLLDKAKSWHGLENCDMAIKVTCSKPYVWDKPLWKHEPISNNYSPLIVAYDYGIKANILRHLVSCGFRVQVVPANTPAKDALAYNPDGIFLSNGPGDPAATGAYAIPIIKELVKSGTPIFGICLGHQLLALSLGCSTEKMKTGHHGINHPILNTLDNTVSITSQNHGFNVSPKDIPENINITHKSLFDDTIAGISHKSLPIFSVQYHPEASPGPHDSMALFMQFKTLLENQHSNAVLAKG